MKLKFYQDSRLTPIKALFCALLLVPIVASATDSVYISPASVTTAPQVDATNFYNSGYWSIITTSPYKTSHTLNYTNVGTMNGSVGWEFDYGPLSNGGRGWSSQFFNDNNGSIVASDSYTYQLANQLTIESHLLVSATNIINKGLLQAGSAGQIVLSGNNVTLTRSMLEITPTISGLFGGFGGTVFSNSFIPDTGIYDLYWTSTNVLTGAGSPWDGTSVAQFTARNAQTPCEGSANETIGPLTPQLSDSLTNSTGAYTIFYTNGSGNPEQMTLYSNVVRQAVFVFLNTNASNITITDHFTPPITDTNPFSPVAVKFSMTTTDPVTLAPEVDNLYVFDYLAAATNGSRLLTNLVINANAPCTDPTARPSNFIVSRSDFMLPNGYFGFADGFPGMGPPAASFFYDPTFASFRIRGAAAAYSALVDNLAAEPPTTGLGADITNAPGRIRIFASNLNLSKTRMRAESEIMIQASNLINNSGSVIDCQNLSFNLGVTNGSFNFSNLAASQVERLNGVVSMWSGYWTNAIVNVLSNYTFSTSNSVWVLTPITNISVIHLAMTVIDASALSNTVPVTVQDLVLHSTNIVLSDSATVVKHLFFDGTSLDLLGSLTLSGSLLNWDQSLAPTLRYFTNNANLTFSGEGHFGDDTAANYAAFVNNGFIFSGDQFIDASSLQINNGFDWTMSGDFVAFCDTGLIANSYIYSQGDIQFYANSLEIDSTALSARNAIDFTVTNRLADSGYGTGNYFQCGNGFNLFVKPATGDLLGTQIIDTAPGQAEVDHLWAGQDRGAVAAGFSNNVAIGTLSLNPSSTLFEPLFYFSGATAGNAMYVSNLDLSALTDYANEIDISGMNIYYVSASLNGTNGAEQFLNGQQFPSGGHLYWVSGITSLAKTKNLATQKFALTANYNNLAQQFQLTENLLMGQTNVTEASTDLVHWTSICTNIGSYSNFGPTTISDPDASNYRSRYYRFRILQ